MIITGKTLFDKRDFCRFFLPYKYGAINKLFIISVVESPSLGLRRESTLHSGEQAIAHPLIYLI